MNKGRWLCAAVALLAACKSHESPQQAQARMEKESEAFTAAVSGNGKRYAGWLAAGQADSIAGIFSEQGREMPPNELAVVGRPAIKAYEVRNAANFAQKIQIRGESYMASGPLGVERGTFSIDGKAKPGAPKSVPRTFHDDGKYLIHWHQVNGQWRMVDLIWNSNRSMMPPAKPAASKSKHTHTTTPAKTSKTKTKKK